MIRHLDSSQPDFDNALTTLLGFSEEDQSDVTETVRQIIRDVRFRGDSSVLELTNRFDGRSVENMTELTVDKSRLENAFNNLAPRTADALRFSADRIRVYHEKQLKAGGASWDFTDELGNRLGQRVRAALQEEAYRPWHP